ncbi:MAG: hypothetical protein K5906_01435 [Bacilli bacterium]|nr:hypothetical protein [Bacilli bacterium]
MKISLKAILACVAFVLFGASIGMFALSFIDSQTVVLSKTTVTELANGFEIAFGQTNLEGKNILGTLFAFIFVAVGALAACYGVLFSLTKKSKADKKVKMLCAICSFVVTGLVPAVLLFLTVATVGASDSSFAIGGLVGASCKLGIGAILAGIFSLVGSCCLSVSELQ